MSLRHRSPARSFGILNKVALVVLVCAVVALQPAVSGQQRVAERFAYDSYVWFQDESGWGVLPEVRIDDGGPSISIRWGEMPTWSADGVRVAFAGAGIHVFDRADGSVVTLSTSGSSPRWSPDGARIAFTDLVATPGAYATGLFVMNADGSNRTRLADSVHSFAWAPNGATIALGRPVDGIEELYLVDADGTDPRRLTYALGVRGGISWSPDGSRIAFNCDTDVCAISTGGTNLVQLIAGARDALFSPAVDGKIAFLTADSQLSVMDANGTVVRVAPGLLASQPTWSPDGRRLAFVKVYLSGGGCNGDGSPCRPDDEIHVVNADGTGLSFVDYGHHPTWWIPRPGHPTAAFTYTCAGATCQFDGTGSFDPDGTIASYLWNFGDGSTSSEPSPAHTYGTGASYLVSLAVTDVSGTMDVTRSRVEANTSPIASFTVVCNGAICTFDGSGSSDPDGTVASYRWYFGDGSEVVSEGPLVTHTYPTGTFSASLSVVDNGGASSAPVSGAAVTVVNAPPVASFVVTCTYLTCAADGTASSDADGTVRSYTWNFGAGQYAEGPVVYFGYPAAGAYTITLTVTDDVNQTNSAARTVSVAAPPPPAIHIGDLDASSSVLRTTWNAFASVQVHTHDHADVIQSVTVAARWEDGTTASCTTAWGRCEFYRYGLPKKINAVTLTVTGITSDLFVYDSGANHDPDGDSAGGALTVRRQ